MRLWDNSELSLSNVFWIVMGVFVGVAMVVALGSLQPTHRLERESSGKGKDVQEVAERAAEQVLCETDYCTKEVMVPEPGGGFYFGQIYRFALVKVEQDTLLQVEYVLEDGTSGTERFSLGEVFNCPTYTTGRCDLKINFYFERRRWSFSADTSVVPVQWLWLRFNGHNVDAEKLLRRTARS